MPEPGRRNTGRDGARRTDFRLMQNRVYVGNLGENVAASTLQELFEPYGFVMDVKMVKGENSERIVGSALVTMATDESATAAITALNGAALNGASIKVEASGGPAPVEGPFPGGKP
jgi:RNA recognition motif-containing protein